MLNITIFGSGWVGSTLGRRWAEFGHKVTFGSRDPESPNVRSVLEQCSGNANATAHDKAISSATDVVVLATPWPVTLDLVHNLAEPMDGKVVVDCTNPLRADLQGLTLGHDTSAAEQIAAAAPGARVVKAFNCTGADNMADPTKGGFRDDAFMCGDEAGAKRVVGELAKQLGFEVIDCGDLNVARYLEPLAMLYIHLALHQRVGRNITIKIMHRDRMDTGAS